MYSSTDSLRNIGNSSPTGSGSSGSGCSSPLLGQQLTQFGREVVDLLKSHPFCR